MSESGSASPRAEAALLAARPSMRGSPATSDLERVQGLLAFAGEVHLVHLDRPRGTGVC